jgi:hypothetical protein
VFGNRVATVAQSRNDLDAPSTIRFPHRLWFNVRRISVNQYQPRNFAHVEVRKRAHVVAAEGVSHQNEGLAPTLDNLRNFLLAPTQKYSPLSKRCVTPCRSGSAHRRD